jgi:hypothetical protein
VKTTTKTFEKPAVPASTYERRFYQCETCDFESTDSEETAKHEGRVHAATKFVTILPIGTFLFLETQAKAEGWLDAQDGGWRTSMNWDGPGWYHVLEEAADSRYSSYDGCIKLVPATEKLHGLIVEIDTITAAKDELAALLMKEGG